MKRFSKEQTDYVDQSNRPGEQCSKCEYFENATTCQIVVGRISPGGWCNRFELEEEPTDTRAVGLADNGTVRFQCGTCEYFNSGICHNKHPKLSGRRVEASWCCNLYDHEGMRVVVP